jgi:hypothetical protein
MTPNLLGFPGWRKDDGIKQLINLRYKGKERKTGYGIRDTGHGIRAGGRYQVFYAGHGIRGSGWDHEKELWSRRLAACYHHTSRRERVYGKGIR